MAHTSSQIKRRRANHALLARAAMDLVARAIATSPNSQTLATTLARLSTSGTRAALRPQWTEKRAAAAKNSTLAPIGVRIVVLASHVTPSLRQCRLARQPCTQRAVAPIVRPSPTVRLRMGLVVRLHALLVRCSTLPPVLARAAQLAKSAIHQVSTTLARLQST